jgi:hypothetical protein
VEPATIGAIATLLTAAVALATHLVSPKPAGKPWMVGVTALGIVGVVLLVVALLPNHPGDDQPPPAPALIAYQNKVVPICTEDREVELEFKRQLEQMQQVLMSGDFSALLSIPKLMTDAVIEEQGLADRLETLVPPADPQPVQSEAVSMWRRKLAVSREIRDQVEKDATASGGDPLKFAQDLQHLDYKEETRLESQKDVLLRRLGGSDCKPSP